MEKACPTPEKIVFASREAAARSRSARRNQGKRMVPYKCPAGHWHLRSWEKEIEMRRGRG